MNASVVVKPGTVYLMAVWAFLGIGSFLSSLIRLLFEQGTSVYQIGSLAVLAGTITLIIYLIKFQFKALVCFGVLSLALAIYQTINFLFIVFNAGFQPILFFLTYYIIPSFILGLLALSKNYRDSSKTYTRYQHQEAMRKVALKSVGR